MKVTAPSRFTFSIYYPRWVSRCNTLIGDEGSSSIEICFQHLLPLSLYCLVCLCSLSYVISFSNLSVSIFLMRFFSPCSSSLVNTLLKVRLGFRCAFSSMHFCLLRTVPTLLWWIPLFAINQASTFKLSAQMCRWLSLLLYFIIEVSSFRNSSFFPLNCSLFLFMGIWYTRSTTF